MRRAQHCFDSMEARTGSYYDEEMVPRSFVKSEKYRLKISPADVITIRQFDAICVSV